MIFSYLYYIIFKYIVYTRLRRIIAATGYESLIKIYNKYSFNIDMLIDNIKYIK